MFVGRRMQKNPITLQPGDKLHKASKLIKQHGIRHLPVVDEAGHLVGILTDRDVKKASASDASTLDIHELLYLLEKIPVSEIMTKNVASVSPSMPLEQAAQLLHDKKFGCLPVVEGEKLVGIITVNDILQFLMDAMDVTSPCTRLEVELPDQPGALVHFLNLIQPQMHKLLSVITSPERSQTKLVTLHLLSPDPGQLKAAIQASGVKLLSFLEQKPL